MNGLLVTTLVALVLLSVLMASIACDEARRLGRRLDDLEHKVRRSVTPAPTLDDLEHEVRSVTPAPTLDDEEIVA